jgi:alpha-1,2-mannosyltransferase
MWHALGVVDHWRQAHKERHGRDFASYYYAVQVGADGGNPYDRKALASSSREDETRKSVHPFFYPPPFVAATAWLRPMELQAAYRVWFWLDELFTLACGLLLWRWWRPLDDSVSLTVVLCLGFLTAIPNNHVMGQANFPVLFLVLLALFQDDEGNAWRAGALMGAACMLKMSPGLFVAWWLLRGRWVSALAACGSAVVYSVLALPWVSLEHQWHFYSAVLPGFGSGDYNGLSVGIDLFGNHSIPNLLDGIFPNEIARDTSLSSMARTLSSAALVGLVAALGWCFREGPADRLAQAGQVGAICAAMLMVPVFTYEHHLVWLIPGVVVAVAAIARRRLPLYWTWLVGLAITFWAFDLADLKLVYMYVKSSYSMLAVGIREAKFASVLCVFVACVVVGRSADEGKSGGSIKVSG